MRIGAHVSVAKGLASAVTYAAEVGCETIQIFAKSPQQWSGPKKEPVDAAAFRSALAKAGIAPVFTHAAYLINIGSRDAVLHERSIEALADELERGALLGAEAVVLHMGTRAYDETTRAADYAAASIRAGWDRACQRCDPPRIAFENSSGAGRAYGTTVEQLCAVAEAVGHAVPTAFCLDTCHAHAAGLDVVTGKGWADLAELFERLCGLERLLVVHANDCAYVKGERRDRHAWVGDGTIGRDGFRAMLAESRLAHAAAIVEMPGEPPVKDAENVRRLKSWRADAAERV